MVVEEEAKVYFISRVFGKPIKVVLKGIPPCLWCGKPVNEPSCDGPLVCPWCDMGKNDDGSNWTQAQYEVRAAHFRAQVTKYIEEEAKAHG